MVQEQVAAHETHTSKLASLQQVLAHSKHAGAARAYQQPAAPQPLTRPTAANTRVRWAVQSRPAADPFSCYGINSISSSTSSCELEAYGDYTHSTASLASLHSTSSIDGSMSSSFPAAATAAAAEVSELQQSLQAAGDLHQQNQLLAMECMRLLHTLVVSQGLGARGAGRLAGCGGCWYGLPACLLVCCVTDSTTYAACRPSRLFGYSHTCCASSYTLAPQGGLAATVAAQRQSAALTANNIVPLPLGAVSVVSLAASSAAAATDAHTTTTTTTPAAATKQLVVVYKRAASAATSTSTESSASAFSNKVLPPCVQYLCQSSSRSMRQRWQTACALCTCLAPWSAAAPAASAAVLVAVWVAA